MKAMIPTSNFLIIVQLFMSVNLYTMDQEQDKYTVEKELACIPSPNSADRKEEDCREGTQQMQEVFMQPVLPVSSSILSDAAAFECAVLENNQWKIILLLQADAAVDTQSPDGSTPLIIAAQYDKEAALHCLLNRHAQVNATTRAGSTALMQAAQYGHCACVSLLLDHSADTTVCDSEGMTALDYALREYYKDIVNLIRVHRNNNEKNAFASLCT